MLPRAPPIVDSMAANVIMDLMMKKSFKELEWFWKPQIIKNQIKKSYKLKPFRIFERLNIFEMTLGAFWQA